MSFRLRLILINAAMVSLVLGAGMWLVVWRSQAVFLESIDREMNQRVMRMVGEMGRDRGRGPFGPPPGNRQDFDPGRPLFLSADGRSIFDERQPLDAKALSLANENRPLFSTVTRDEEQFRVLTVALRKPNDPNQEGPVARYVQIGHGLRDFERMRETQLGVVMVLLPLGVLFSALVGSFLAERALRPIRRLTSAAQSIEPSKMDERLEEVSADELGVLARTFNAMLGRLQSAFQERDEVNRRLEENLERQKRFVADASHELRTPLARLRLTTSGALQQDSDPEELTEALQIADQAGASMTRLVEQLLSLARLDQREGLSESTCFVSEVINEARTVLTPLTPNLVINATSNARVRGEVSDLSRAVINLVDNARRHSPADSPVTIATSLTNGGIEISISDKGDGIPPEKLARLGERFYRVDEHRSRNDGGSGLGLSIVRSIVERSGGELRITSQVGIGTTATVSLPIFSEIDFPNKSQTSES